MVTGLARLVDEPGQAARYQDVLQPWVSGETDHVIRIDPQAVTRFELIPGGSSTAV